jgi:hypothetical protein
MHFSSVKSSGWPLKQKHCRSHHRDPFRETNSILETLRGDLVSSRCTLAALSHSSQPNFLFCTPNHSGVQGASMIIGDSKSEFKNSISKSITTRFNLYYLQLTNLKSIPRPISRSIFPILLFLRERSSEYKRLKTCHFAFVKVDVH